MKYMGSKARIAKEVLPLLAIEKNSVYVEPFVGGANMIDKVTSSRRVGADIDEDLICLWQAVSDGWMPPQDFTEDEYQAIRAAPTSPLKGYAAFALSYGGKKFGGWCRDKAGRRNYVAEAYRNAVRQFPLLRGVEFVQSSYESLEIPSGAVVYCDPPYANSTQYASDFDHNDFWEWVRTVSATCRVFVSEYNAPEDFEPVYARQIASSLTKDTGSKTGVERLWVLRSLKLV